MKHISHREKIMFYTGAVAVICIVFYMFAVEPLWRYWQGLNKSVESKEIQLMKNLKILAQKDTIDKLYEKYSESIKMKGSAEEETAVILREIENIARMSNTSITDIKPQKVQDMDFYKEYYVELEAEGDITNLTKFVYELQNSKQILKVKHLQINPKGESGNVLRGYMIVTKILIP